MFLRFEPKTSGNAFSVKKVHYTVVFPWGKDNYMYIGIWEGDYYGVKADIQRRLRINKHTAISSKKNTVTYINRIKGNMHTMYYGVIITSKLC